MSVTKYPRSLLGCFVLVFCLLGCSDESAEPGNPLDAAFENTGDIMLSGPEIIGDDPGEPLFSLIADITVGSDGRVYVTDAKDARITILSPEGDSVGVLGRRGEGPGEFSGPAHAYFGEEDSLFVYDLGPKGNVVFDPDLIQAYSFRLSRAENNRGGGPAFRLPDASMIGEYVRPFNARFDSAGIWLIPVNRSGEILGPALVDLPQNDAIVDFPNENTVEVNLQPFGRRSLFTQAPDGRYCYAWTEVFRIQCIRSHTDIDTLLAVDHASLPVTDSDRTWYEKRFPSPVLETVTWPETHPAFRDMTFDQEGRLWIQHTTHLGSAETPVPWSVVDVENGTYSTVSIPGSQRVLDATGAFVYAATSGDQEPLVYVYRVENDR